MAVVAISPTETPVSTRATISPGSDDQKRKHKSATTATYTAGSSTRRPSTSEKWPSRNRLSSTPTAYAANTKVTVVAERWSRAW